MQRRGRPAALTPTLLEGPPRTAEGEFADVAGLAPGEDPKAAMHAAGSAWKERICCRLALSHISRAMLPCASSACKASELRLRAEKAEFAAAGAADEEQQPEDPATKNEAETLFGWILDVCSCCWQRRGH